jgi:hypothetical protein
MAKQEPNISPETSGTISNLTFDQLKELLSAAKGDSNSAVAVLADTMERLVAAQNRSADATEKTITRSNAVHPGISSFSNPKGEVADFEGVVQNEEQLTPTEIDMFNRITSDKTAREGKWIAQYVPSIGSGKPALSIRLGVRNYDDLLGLPPLVQILTELAMGAEATDVAKLFEKMAAMQAEIESFKQSQVATETVGA